jgi:hypothetical protein
MNKTLTIGLFLVSFPVLADYTYFGIGGTRVSQDIGMQAEMDTPLDNTGCNYSDCGREGGASDIRSTMAGHVFAGYRKGDTAFEIGLHDLGTYQIIGYVNYTDGRSIKDVCNVTMSAFSVSALQYWGGAYTRFGVNYNKMVDRCAAYHKQSDGSQTNDYFTVSGSRGGLQYGLGYEFNFNDTKVRAEYFRFDHVGVIDITGTTAPRGIELSLVKEF